MPGLCVVGLQWGDEAKGKLVDILTAQNDVVVRYQGGANAGHTVVHGDQTYKLHHIPSGILNRGVKNVVTAGVVMNPPTILEEIDSLLARDVPVAENLMISDRVHVVFPWHIAEDRLINEAVTGDANIGTTLRGIGPCYQDKVGRTNAIRLGDFYRPSFKDRVCQVAQTKQRLLQAYQPSADLKLDGEAIYQEFKAYADRLEPFVYDTTHFLLDAVEENKKLLFEGAQGALLDIDHGTYPFVTSSNSSGVGVSAGSGVPAKWIDHVVGVAKSYSTRVGGGPFPTELHDDVGQLIRDTGNEYGTTTGRPRRCGWFDAVAVRYTRRLSGVDSIALMMLDVLSVLDKIEVCTAYEIDGQRVDRFPGHAEALKEAKPIYETLPGWKEDVTGCRSYDQLPENARAYVERIETLIGCPVKYVSVGPDREQTIFRD